MEIIVAKDYAEMSRKAADVIAACLKENPATRLGLATGSTPEGLYACLVKDYQAGLLDFSQASSFNLDEYRGLAHDHDQSYHYFMKKNLFDAVNIDPANTAVPDGANPDAQAACDEYEAAIEAAGGVDIQLLGMGHNGHIGFNEPADEFPKQTHCVDLTESTISANSRLFDSAEEVPRQAYTMGIGTIMKAKKILVVANGTAKAAIVRDAFTGAVTPSVPASILQFHPDVTVVLDADAASLLA
ncbi:MAG: glucosamine-6-phosphate deaminase [Eggerthellaceae bacterium]|jgi:glucosamine-6-phosphate deaminase|nr:glucosamine-6-phosphate deaminase [Eggerthellaceae bacterium]MDR2721542.1 glucosamine-6-phosphate deaminase [Coriobacteriaceae bacterium]